jgi:hypothetical protein
VQGRIDLDADEILGIVHPPGSLAASKMTECAALRCSRSLQHNNIAPAVIPRVMVTWWRLRRAHIEMAADAERGGNRARGERREVVAHQHFSCQ